MKNFIIFIAIFLASITVKGQWTTIPSGTNSHFTTVQFPTDSIGFITGSDAFGNGIILKTSDAGTNWDTSYFNPSFRIYSVYFPNETTGFANNGDTIFKTTDGGTSWTALNYSFNNFAKGLFFLNSNIGYYAVGGNVYKTLDGGNSWTYNYPGCLSNTDGIYFFNQDTGVIGGWYDPRFAKTTDGGITWTVTNTSYGIYSLHFASASVGYAVGGNIIFKSTDAGDSWTQLVSGLPITRWLFSVYSTNVNTCFAVGDSGAIIQTTDGGNSWIIQNSGTTQKLSSVFCTNIYCYAVGDSGIILRTANTTSVDEYISSTENQIAVFPNPAINDLNIQNNSTQQFQFTLYNSLGEKLIDKILTNKTSTINLSSFSNDIYFYQVSNVMQLIKSGKIIKQ